MKRLFVSLFLLLAFLYACGTKQNYEYENLLPYPEDLEVVTDTHLLDLGNPEARIFMNSGWSTDQKEGQNTFSVLEDRKGSISFHCLTLSEKLLSIRCKTTGQKPLVLIPTVNRERLKPQKVGTEFAELIWMVPTSALVSGRNELTLVTRDAEQFQDRIAIDSIRFSENGQETNQREERAFRTKIEDGLENVSAIAASVPSSISTYVKMPADAAIEIRYGMANEGFFDSLGAEFSIYVEDQKLNSRKILSAEKTRRFFAKGNGTFVIAADQFPNQIVRLTFEAFPVNGKKSPKHIYWQSAIVRSKAEPSTTRPVSTKPNVFFYLMDAARADHLQPYGYSRQTSPRITQFSKDSVLFENAYSHASWTRPAVASILTGLYPSAHRAVDRVDLLPESVPTLQRILKSNGYRNFCFSAQPNVGPTFRFERDFDVFRLITKDQKHQAQSDRVYQELETFLAKNSPRSSFFYIHVIDTHRPYLPLKQFQNAFGKCRATEEELSKEEKTACAMEQYDNLVLQSDFYFGKFLDLLKAKKLYDDSLIVLTADHGESFWEHQLMGHGKSLYQPEIKVPLIVHFPKGEYSGKRVKPYARHIDVFATILEEAGIPLPADVDSLSLRKLVETKENSERPVFSELSLDREYARSLISGEHKIIYKGGERPGYQLFDLKNDPLERHEISLREPIVFGYMKQALNQWIREQIKKGEAHKSEKAVLDPDTEEMLKGLGYLQ